MKPSIRARDLAGWLMVVALLALAGPGVTIVRAEQDAVASFEAPPPGPSCQAGDRKPHGLSLDFSKQLAEGQGSGVVALDTGGYRYDEKPAAREGEATVQIVVVPVN
jgi:hypothetical protein